MQQTAFNLKSPLHRSTSSFEQLQVHVRHDPRKRLFDIGFSLAALVFLSPVYALLALLVKSSSKGPIFYKSRRLGRGGKLIHCLKFRTMYEDADSRLHQLLSSNPGLAEEWKLFYKLKKDPRITRIGSFLRKTSLDELPQFFNVLRGDLSVVGPRAPALIGQPELYGEEIQSIYGDHVAKILSVRPGITGLWQVSGRSFITLEEKQKIEIFYVENRTFLSDLTLIFKTIPALFFSKGAF